MVRGLYTAAAGMLVEWNREDVIANNLANVDTAGFKKDTAIIRAFPQQLVVRTNDTYLQTSHGKIDLRPPIGVLGTGAEVEEVFTRFTEGKIKETEQELDVAIEGDGFFVVQTPDGLRYTRCGAFSRNREGELVTEDGYSILGLRGTVVLRGEKVRFAEDGSIYVDGVLQDRLRIVDFPNLRGLEKMGKNLFQATPSAGPETPAVNFRLRQGYLESSNVNTVEEMVDMIRVLRAYEANSRMITSQDSTLDLVINRVGERV